MAEKTILKPYIPLTRSRFTKHHAQDSIVKNLFCGLVVLIAMIYPAHIQAQFADFGFGEKPPVEKLSAKGYLSIDKVQPGSQFQIAVVVEIVEGWHVNANPAGEGLIATEVIFPDTPHFTFGEVVYPTGEVLALGSIGEAPVYHDTIAIGVQADLSQTAPIAPMMLDLELRYQACNDEQCLLPEVLTFAVPIEIVGIEDTIQRINEAVSPMSNSVHRRVLVMTKVTSRVHSLVGRFGSHSCSCLPGAS